MVRISSQQSVVCYIKETFSVLACTSYEGPKLSSLKWGSLLKYIDRSWKSLINYSNKAYIILYKHQPRGFPEVFV